MKFIGCFLLTAGLFSGAELGDAQTPAEPTVTVCMERCPHARMAQQVASRIFADIGVRLDWRHFGRSCPDDAIRIMVNGETPAEFMPAALAFAQPFEGSRIVVFYDRVSRAGADHITTVAGLLGHVLAHEIGHILQGMDHHSEAGVMQARWRNFEILDMWRQPLSFTPLDEKLIGVGIEARNGPPQT